jgi:hypothetical protein
LFTYIHKHTLNRGHDNILLSAISQGQLPLRQDFALVHRPLDGVVRARLELIERARPFTTAPVVSVVLGTAKQRAQVRQACCSIRLKEKEN